MNKTYLALSLLLPLTFSGTIQAADKFTAGNLPVIHLSKNTAAPPEATSSNTQRKSLAADNLPAVSIHQVQQNIVKMGLARGINLDDAVSSMISKGNELNLKLVARQQVHKEMAARGITTPHLQILQFCSPDDAIELVTHSSIFAAFLPCRISIVEDNSGQVWLYMINLDMQIDEKSLPPNLQATAIRVNQKMLAILTAGATGDF